jgi:hypothetical protein
MPIRAPAPEATGSPNRSAPGPRARWASRIAAATLAGRGDRRAPSPPGERRQRDEELAAAGRASRRDAWLDDAGHRHRLDHARIPAGVQLLPALRPGRPPSPAGPRSSHGSVSRPPRGDTGGHAGHDLARIAGEDEVTAMLAANVRRWSCIAARSPGWRGCRRCALGDFRPNPLAGKVATAIGGRPRPRRQSWKASASRTARAHHAAHVNAEAQTARRHAPGARAR